MSPPFWWRLTNFLQRNLPKCVESQDYLTKDNEHGVSSSHWFAMFFSALPVQDHLLLGLLLLVKQMQKVPRTFWCLREDVGKSPSYHCQLPPFVMEAGHWTVPMPLTGPSLPWLLLRHTETTSFSSLIWGDSLFCLHIELHSFCLYV